MATDNVSHPNLLTLLDLFARHAAGENSKALFLEAKDFCAGASIPDIFEPNFALTPYSRKLWPRLHDATTALNAASRMLVAEGAGESGSVFIVGSAHFDIIASYDESQRRYRDKVGHLSFSIGGTGFHVASELARHGRQVAIATFLNANSLTSDSIFNSIRDSGIETSYVQFYQGPEESAFVAHVCGEEMISAVSHMHVETCQFPADLLIKGVGSSSVVVADTNLSPAQLAALAEICDVYARPLFIAAVSEPKLRRLLDSRANSFLVAMNEQEFTSIGLTTSTKEDITRACQTVRTEHIVVTRGERGYSILGEAGWSLDFAAPAATNIVSTNGAGDSLLAALTSFYLSHFGAAAPEGAAFWEGCEQLVADYVIPRMAARAAALTPFIQPYLPVHDAPEVPPTPKKGFWGRK